VAGCGFSQERRILLIFGAPSLKEAVLLPIKAYEGRDVTKAGMAQDIL
jgi:hypothetical protein